MEQHDFQPMAYRQIQAGPLTLRVKTNGHVEVDYDEHGEPLWQGDLNQIALAAQEFIDDYNNGKTGLMALADQLKTVEERCEARADLRVMERKLENELDLREVATDTRSMRESLEAETD